MTIISTTQTKIAPMKKKLEGKVAIVTGGASGIGEATVRLFIENGALAVVIADIQGELGQSLADSIGLNQCRYMHCDITNEEHVKTVVNWTVKMYGRLDIMFSNAGTLSSSKQTILDLDISKYDFIMQVNSRGMALCVKHAARKMVELGTRGAIVCTGSTGSTMGGLKQTDYIMSKHAVLGLMKSASLQLAEHGIRVNCVSPSGVETPLAGKMEKFIAEGNISEPSLKGVVLTAGKVAEAVLFLASDDSSFVTGHNLMVNGGLTGIPF